MTVQSSGGRQSVNATASASCICFKSTRSHRVTVIGSASLLIVETDFEEKSVTVEQVFLSEVGK